MEQNRKNQNLKRHKWWLVGVLLIANVFVWWSIGQETPSGILRVHFLDVGQGDAALIVSPTGNQILVDGGPGKQILRELAKYKGYFDNNIDLAIESHPDSDHIGGLPDVFSTYKVSGFLEPGSEGKSSDFKKLKDDVLAKKADDLIGQSGEKIDLGGGAFIEIIFPKDGRGMETNASSLIFKLTYDERSFLFVGDTPANIESYLVNSGQNLHADVYKVSHHGSKNSNTQAFIDLVSPEIAVISVGKDNRYGHPNKEVIDELNKDKIKILRTDLLGDISIETDGKNLIVKE